jgi:hypothetical protein
MRMIAAISRLAMPLGAALALAACGPAEEEERNLEAGADDLSGGEFIVNEEDPNAVPVDTPEVPMTPVPESELNEGTAEPASGAAEPAAGQ